MDPWSQDVQINSVGDPLFLSFFSFSSLSLPLSLLLSLPLSLSLFLILIFLGGGAEQ